MVKNSVRILVAALLLCAGFPFQSSSQTLRVRDLDVAADSINRYLSRRAAVTPKILIDTFFIKKDRKEQVIEIHFKESISEFPIRDKDLNAITGIIRNSLPKELQNTRIELYTKKQELSRLSSGFYSGRTFTQDPSKRPADKKTWITQNMPGRNCQEGLKGRTLALWPGHGYYYSHVEDRWKWQRAPFFSTIEDLLPQSYIISFLAPMLENAGATVILPRERDMQLNEIIVDNSDPYYTERNGNPKKPWKNAPSPGFADILDFYVTGQNPFTQGDARMIACDLKNPSSATYIPYFPESGDYAVYVSYQTVDKSAPALYTVRYWGGEADFTIDQSMGGGTWVYLGTFRFSKGETGQGVIVQNCAEESNGQGVITTDAVRFGGGTGNIVRGNGTSNVPRYAEAARYWLQWSGFPEEVYSQNNDYDDYKDDYMSRGKWVNDLKNRLNIPVDLALALHTDAGSVLNDSTIGTLAIYKEESEGKTRYSDGRPRIMSRELADIVQTSIVNDIRAQYRPDWTRRAIWDRSYMEARVPDVPTVLIELLSHQNYPDMQCALDPKFKFIVSRAIYKGILRYLAYTDDLPYCVQPLPVRDFSIRMTDRKKDRATIMLDWAPGHDPEEPSAEPDSYIVYRRVSDTAYSVSGPLPGFDNGTLVTGTTFKDEIFPGRLYSYKIVAVNKGGVSFPSETLSAGYIPDAAEALIVNAFTNVSAPAPYPVCDSVTAGFDFRQEHGIPYICDGSYLGEQFEYLRQRQWIHDDRPGFGASYMDYGPAPVAGNTYDYPQIHGLSMMRTGLSFCSTSLSAMLRSDNAGLTDYSMIDIIAGKDGEGLFCDTLYRLLSDFCSEGGSILISGAHIGKNSAYDNNTQYSGQQILRDARTYANKAAAMLDLLRDSLSCSVIQDTGAAILAELTDAATRIRELSSMTEKKLEKDISAMQRNADPDFIANRLAADIFHYGWSNGSATTTGNVRSVSNPAGIFRDSCLNIGFNTKPNPRIYCVESPDAILPSDDEAFTFMRYEGANTSAAVAYDGAYRCVSFGFPIEALTSQHQVDTLMCEVIRFLLRRQ